MNHFKVKIRKTCKICGDKITGIRYRTYCSKKCRTKANNKKAYKRQREWTRNKRGEFKPGKIQCQICGKYYRQVGTHIYHRHHITAREYRKEYGFDVKRGQLSKDLWKIKKDYVFENGTILNLKKGKINWFKKGQKGIGVYERSEQTLNRLKNLHKFNKNYEQRKCKNDNNDNEFSHRKSKFQHAHIPSGVGRKSSPHSSLGRRLR
jgi:hypothetical protein